MQKLSVFPRSVDKIYADDFYPIDRLETQFLNSSIFPKSRSSIFLDDKTEQLFQLLTTKDQVCELRGESHSGKTQTAIWLTARFLVAGHSVIYVDADNSMCADRLFSILVCLSVPKEEWDAVLQRLRVITVRDCDELIKTLNHLTNEPNFSTCRFLVLDSLEGATGLELLGNRNELQRDYACHIVQTLIYVINRLLSFHFLAQSSFSMLVCAGNYRLHGNHWTNRTDQQFRLKRINRKTVDQFVFIQRACLQRTRRFDVIIEEGGLRCIEPDQFDKQQNLDN